MKLHEGPSDMTLKDRIGLGLKPEPPAPAREPAPRAATPAR